MKQQIDYGRIFVRVGVIVGLIASVIQLFPSGDMEGHQVADYQPVKLAAMEGLFQTENGAGIVIIGQPDTKTGKLDNPIIVPNVLSFLTYRRWTAQVKGLDSFPADQRPDSIELLYYSYHIMVGLGTIFIAIMGLAALLALAAPALQFALDALGTVVGDALPFYRQYRGLVHHRNWPSALDSVWHAAYRAGFIDQRFGRKRAFYPAGLYAGCT